MEENKITESEELEEELEEELDGEPSDGTEDADGEELSDDNPFSFIEDEEEEEDELDEDEEDEESEDESEDGEGEDDNSSANESELEKEAKALLKKLGMKDGEDPVTAARRLRDEADGVDPAKRAAREAWETRAKADIEEIHKAFPETKQYKTLGELPHRMKFARLMDDPDAGLTAVEAFAASHPEIVSAHVAGAKHSKNLRDTKDHLVSSVPKRAGGESGISDRELRALKRDFPDMTDKEIRQYYKKING